ncbi:hypothetical protein L3Q82_018372 [Scortum barcoo]|uniref:Uncharacterized protein n=1 Tax=Scortum barcoo TaxID=214431 RepID=A0ACB8VIP1_9TELE|nr:hypothetical protein L3Q82_018372 [Scortum barcoo]
MPALVQLPTPPSPPLAPPRPVRLAPLEKYSGDSWSSKRETAVIPELAHSDYPDLSRVPPCYHDLCAPISKAQLYAISGPERKAMDEYIEALLPSGIICPSSSPAGAGFLFVGKKDGSLRLCIDYSALNDIMVKNRYPLPLISSAFELPQQARVFTKLDLRNAYCLVRIREDDEWKTGFNTARGHYKYLVMPLGLTNTSAVFQSFINEVLPSCLLGPDSPAAESAVRKAEKCEFHASSVLFLGFIVSASHVPLQWSPPAEEAFKRLKRLFTTAPVLTMLYPKLQFVVEVDASNQGKAEQPFIIWTDHKNLEYLRSFEETELTPGKVGSFFFVFRFSLSYRPGSQNTKPDVLSHLYEPEPEPPANEPEPILPPDHVVGANRTRCAANKPW